jgi:hypothetical protein
MVGTGINFDCIINWNVRMEIFLTPLKLISIYATVCMSGKIILTFKLKKWNTGGRAEPSDTVIFSSRTRQNFRSSAAVRGKSELKVETKRI